MMGAFQIVGVLPVPRDFLKLRIASFAETFAHLAVKKDANT